MNDKLLFLKQMGLWVDEQHKSVAKSTVSNRRSTYNKVAQYMEEKEIEDFDLFEYDFTVQRPNMERLKKGEWIENFFLGFRDWLGELGYVQEGTTNQHRTNLVVFLNWSKFKRIGLSIPVPEFFRNRVVAKDRVAALSPQQTQELLRLPKTTSHAINAAFAVLTCWRVSDLVSLRVKDIELDKGRRYYWISKTMQKTKRLVRTPVPFALMSRILKYYGHDPSRPGYADRYLIHFDTPCQEGIPRARRFAHDVRKALHAAFGPDATIKTVAFDGRPVYMNISEYTRAVHLLRRSGATYYASMGMPEETIAALFTGHDDVKTLKNYYIDPVTQRAHLEGDFAFNDGLKALYGYNEIVTGKTGRKDERIMENIFELLNEEE